MYKKLNNKGYMLVEIILAFVIAMGVTYFMFELIIKLKNKNDDLIVKTLVATDQTIIYNTIMKDLSSYSSFDCDKIRFDENKFEFYDEYIIDVSEYAGIGDVECNISGNEVSIKIPIEVKQLNDNFDVNIKYKLDESLPSPPVSDDTEPDPEPDEIVFSRGTYECSQSIESAAMFSSAAGNMETFITNNMTILSGETEFCYLRDEYVNLVGASGGWSTDWPFVSAYVRKSDVSASVPSGNIEIVEGVEFVFGYIPLQNGATCLTSLPCPGMEQFGS